ncbi:hypothetical protein LCGC14_1006970 [marine sediment metagenome]|uniref:Uncharacterized protein n=1 Tax=marine sediment metagenome TaxID=412755 RepID=A0A0F9R7J4_9ZZZZ
MKTHEIKAIETMLEIYTKTNDSVSQEFYQGLCAKAVEIIKQLQKELTDYKVGCDSLKNSVSDLCNERDKFKNTLKIILRNIKGNAVSISWIKQHIEINCKDIIS